MPWIRGSRCVAACLLTAVPWLLVGSIGPRLFAAEELVAVASASLREQLSSIQTLEIDFEHVVSHKGRQVRADAARVATIMYELRLDGARTRLETRLLAAGGACLNRTINAFDGRYTYNVEYESQDPQAMKAFVRLPERAVQALVTPVAFLGLRFLTLESDRSLASMLGDASLRVEDAAGAGLVRGTIRDVALTSGQRYAVEFLLDGSVDWLPRQIRARPHQSPNPAAGDEDFHTFDLHAAEFGRFDDPLTGRQRWFPTLCRQTMAGKAFETRVTRVAINSFRAPELFTIRALPGARVVDFAVPAGQAPHTYYEGGIATQQRALQETVDRALQASAPELVPVQALPKSGVLYWWPRMLFWAAGTLLALIAARWLASRYFFR